jgi:Zn-dependent M28 family amino/carboxypeptidase
MRVVQSTSYPPRDRDPDIDEAANVSIESLRTMVEIISYPRHYVEQPEANAAAGRWIEEQFVALGYETVRQGEYDNIVTLPPGGSGSDGPTVLVGAHYDSKPTTPGADDNGSAVASLLATAKAVAEHAPKTAVMFAAFNREEDGLLGSKDFVANFLPTSPITLREVHVLEMIGYTDKRPGSQRLPRGLPVRLVRDRGDFLALLGNRRSRRQVDSLLKSASGYVPELPVLGLKIPCGLENRFHHLRRSDHAPFWQAGFPALMWTDTAEFRSPHYHQPTDTPDTLDYEFLQAVTRLLIAHVLASV